MSSRVISQSPDGDAPAPALATVGAETFDLATVYRCHADAVARWATRLAGPDADIEDIVQEVFLVVQRRLPQFRGDAKITTWLFEITLRVSRERRRRRWWRRLVGRPDGGDDGGDELSHLAAEQPGPLDLLERREATLALHRILDGVGDKYREVLIMFELEGMSGQEIATISGTSLSNVWIRLFRGRKKVLERFQAWERDGSP